MSKVKYKYGKDSFWQHPEVRPIKKTREVKYTETYYVCPNCGSELKHATGDGASMFSYVCWECGWCF